MLTVDISKQLRKRRRSLGLSLGDVARRAGTTPTALSRYENGWTRFEIQTLHKLATALRCDLSLRLLPQQTSGFDVISPDEACRLLKRLFWDHTLKPSDFKRHRVWVTERVLEMGTLEDIDCLRTLLGTLPFLHAVKKALNRLSPRTRNFWHQILDKEGIRCTSKCFRNTAWIS